jgi:hypothetical protein
MKVFVAQRNYDYEGFAIIGIFTTKEAAQACCDNDFSPRHKKELRKMGDSYDVEEHELQES